MKKCFGTCTICHCWLILRNNFYVLVRHSAMLQVLQLPGEGAALDFHHVRTRPSITSLAPPSERSMIKTVLRLFSLYTCSPPGDLANSQPAGDKFYSSVALRSFADFNAIHLDGILSNSLPLFLVSAPFWRVHRTALRRVQARARESGEKVRRPPAEGVAATNRDLSLLPLSRHASLLLRRLSHRQGRCQSDAVSSSSSNSSSRGRCDALILSSLKAKINNNPLTPRTQNGCWGKGVRRSPADRVTKPSAVTYMGKTKTWREEINSISISMTAR